jgi:hypothetical protein
MEINEKLLKVWKKNIQPPENNKYEYDQLVTFARGEIVLYGLVSWNESRQMYQFELVEKISDTEHKKHTAVLSSENYLFVRAAVRSAFGVYMTKGIYDEQCPPLTSETFFEKFAMTATK